MGAPNPLPALLGFAAAFAGRGLKKRGEWAGGRRGTDPTSPPLPPQFGAIWSDGKRSITTHTYLEDLCCLFGVRNA